jgi:FkbM family methyltransferase
MTSADPSAPLEQLVRRVDKLQRTVEKLSQTTQRGTQTVALDYEHAEILLQVTTRHERKRAFACRKEPWTVAWLEELEQGRVLWDLGANVGAYSFIAAARQLRVVSVEPSFSTYAALCRNVVLNELADRVSPLPVMIGATTGLGILGYSDIDAGASFHAGGVASLREDAGSVYDQPVLTFALDHLVEQFELPAPDYLKLDVDGAELVALQGAARSLAGVRSVMAEIGEDERAAVDALMTDAGLVASGDEYHRSGADGEPVSAGYVRYDRAD